MKKHEIHDLKQQIQIEAKYGVDFILAASVVWILIAFIWTASYSSYNKSVLTFIIGSVLLPLAFGFSKILKTNWKVKDNPLQPLGLWLNFAQLFYFPFLIFVLIKSPDYFIMTYAIITGAHLFPYAWFYDEWAYAISAGLISVGALLFALFIPMSMFYVPTLTFVILLALAMRIFYKLRKARKNA